MEVERWRQIDAVLQELLEREPGERMKFLEETCAADAALRSEVLSLLGQQDNVVNFLELPAFACAAELLANKAEDRAEGRRIGAYKIVSEIGRGGMGTVYLAERADAEFRKHAAIKLIKRGMDTDAMLHRFHAERQILATLEHPGIARLLDGGTTEDGLPYFAMEYVEGLPIDEYCDAHKLSLTDRLKLFRAVCAAVNYAHQNLVIHRDIKPSNILVTKEGEPKLLDFGIAKLLRPDSTTTIGLNGHTVTTWRVMTPEYASPEQVRGETVATTTDVYSLGVMLYKLLTGHHPYRFTNRHPDEMAHIICDEEPGRPSTAVTRTEEIFDSDGKIIKRITPQQVGEMREEQPERLRRKLSGDLDSIVLMAMRKEPPRRYASVEKLSDDIRRHLEGLPVHASKDTFSYRGAKFVKRHKAGTAATALIALSLIAGIIATTRQAHLTALERERAQRQFNDVRQLADSFLFEFHDAIENLPGATEARELVVKRALEYLNKLAQEENNDASLQRELATAYRKVGDVQGNPNFANLGDTQGALASYRKSLAIRESLLAAHPSDASLHREVSESYERVGDILIIRGDMAGAREAYGKSLAIREKLASAAPTNVPAERDLVESYNKLGGATGKSGDVAGAMEYYHKALALLEQLLSADPSNAQLRRDLAYTYLLIGNIFWQSKSPAEALASYRKSLDLYQELAAADPSNAPLRQELSSIYYEIGYSLDEMGDLKGALQNDRQALAIRTELAALDPNNAQARRSAAVGYGAVGHELAKLGDTQGSLENLRQSLALFESLATADPLNAKAQRDLAICEDELGDASARLAASSSSETRAEHWREARAWYQKSLETYLNLRRSGKLRGDDAAEPDNMTRKIASCNAHLAY